MNKFTAFFLGLVAIATSTLMPLYLTFQLHREASVYTSSILEKSKENSQEMILKIPISLPYASNWENALETEGLFEENGKFYTVVSRKYELDTLYTTYLENNNAREIFNQLSEHFEASSTKDQQSSQDKSSLISKLLRADYFRQDAYSWHNFPDSIAQKLTRIYPSGQFFYSNPYNETFTPPPDTGLI